MVGVAVSKVAMLTHCQALTQACNYCEGEWIIGDGVIQHIKRQNVTTFFMFLFKGETLVNVLDFKKDMGLWHGVLTVSIFPLNKFMQCKVK